MFVNFHITDPYEILNVTFCLVVVLLVVIWYLMRRNIKQFKDIGQINTQLSQQSAEMKRVNRALMSMMEDAMLAWDEAAKSRDESLKLAVVVESSNDAIICEDLSGNITYWNAAAQRLYGYSAQDVIGSPLLLLVPEDRTREAKDIRSRLQSGEVINHFETVRKHKDGHLVDVSVNVSLLKDKSGNVLGVSNIARDITQLKQAQYALNERASWLENLIKNANEILLQLDKNGHIIYSSPSMEKILGYKPQERLQHSFFELIHPDDVEQIHLLFEQLLKNPESTVSAECRILHKNGQWCWIIGLGHNLLDDPHIGSIVVNGHDITSIKSATRHLAEREMQYRQIIDTALDAVVSIDAQGSVIDWNKSAEFTFGWAKEEILGQSITKTIIPPQDQQAFETGLQEFGTSGRSELFNKRIEVTALRRDGLEFPVEISMAPVQLQGKVIFTSFMRDISERKRTQERVQQVVESAPNALVMVNQRGNMVFVNTQMEKLFGYSREELIDKPIEILLPESMHTQHGQQRREFFSKPQRRAMGAGRDLFGMKKDGGEVPLEIGLNPIHTPEGTFVLASIVDITERLKSEFKLKKFTQELQQSNKELEQFAVVASHDLQEPLRIVSSYVQLLSQKYHGQLDEKATKYIDYAVGNVERMQAMIDGLLSYSRVGRRDQNLGTLDCNEICEKALANLGNAITKSKAQVDHAPLPKIWGVEVEILQLFQNLIGNAIKYCDKANPQIHISALQQDKDWIFTFKDNGIGISSQYYDRIFELFRRLHNKNDYPGTGLGLAICKKIVEKNGGRIWVESVVGQGSSFYFTIPLHHEVRHEFQNSH